jgi:diacylglycerol kinase family enzyme
VQALNCPRRHILLIYNPISGGGKSKALVDDVVVPVFRLAGVDFTLIRTEFQGFCTKYIKTIAAGSCDCITIAGGDGLLLEAVTG